MAAGCRIAIDTDAHTNDHLAFLRYGVLTARRGRVTPEACVNCLAPDALLTWLAQKTPLPSG